VNVSHHPFLLTWKGPCFLHIGKKQYRIGKGKLTKLEFQQRVSHQETFPVFWARLNERSYYQFGGKFYWDNDDLTAEEVHALLVTRGQAQKRRIDRAQAIVAMGTDGREATQRGHIADDVKQYIWMRDGGKCRHCGATAELQYDHVIPVAMGGSSEQENLQILCGPCNRRKNAGLTMGGAKSAAPAHAIVAQPSAPATLPPAGWFPNPGGEGLRYWDGAAWTEHTHA
jgi:hypothetical protein